MAGEQAPTRRGALWELAVGELGDRGAKGEEAVAAEVVDPAHEERGSVGEAGNRPGGSQRVRLTIRI